MTNDTTREQIQQKAKHYNINPEKLKKLYREHQKTPHEVIGFEEYRELDDEQIFHDGRRYFVAYLDVNEWEHEIKHVIEEEFGEELSYDYIKALQKIYHEKAGGLTNQNLDDVETRWIIFDKTRLDELFPQDTVDFRYTEPIKDNTTGGGCFKVEELHDQEVWLNGDTEDGVIWKPYEDTIAEETKDQELKNFVKIQKIHRG